MRCLCFGELADSVPSSPVPATPTPVEQEYPPSFNATEPLTTPHTVSVLIALVVFVGYAALSRIRLDTTADHTVPGSQNIAQIADKFTNIKTCVCVCACVMAMQRVIVFRAWFVTVCVAVVLMLLQWYFHELGRWAVVLYGTLERHTVHSVCDV